MRTQWRTGGVDEVKKKKKHKTRNMFASAREACRVGLRGEERGGTWASTANNAGFAKLLAVQRSIQESILWAGDRVGGALAGWLAAQ